MYLRAEANTYRDVGRRRNRGRTGHVADHFSYLKGLTERGTAILLGRTQETLEEAIGIVIFKASSEEEARHLMEEDPAVKNGVMSAEVYRFKIALFNPEGVDT